MKGRVGIAGFIAALALVFGAPAAQAAMLTVDIGGDTTNIGDGDCSLREAVEVANDNSETGNEPTCTDDALPASSSDTIALGPILHTLSAPFEAGTPDDNLEGDLDVQDAGTGSLTIDGAGTGATRISTSGLGDRIIHHREDALTVQELTLIGGAAAGVGGRDPG